MDHYWTDHWVAGITLSQCFRLPKVIRLCRPSSTYGNPCTLWNSTKQISIIQQSYNRLTCQVIHRGVMTEPFPVTTWVRQGCLLSPLLFLLVVDWVSRVTYSNPTGLQWTITSCLEDLDFADDICNLSYRLKDPHVSKQQQSELASTPMHKRWRRWKATQTKQKTSRCNFVGLLHHPFWLQLVYALFGHYFSTFLSTRLAQDHLWGFSTRNAHMHGPYR